MILYLLRLSFIILSLHFPFLPFHDYLLQIYREDIQQLLTLLHAYHDPNENKKMLF